MGRPETWGRYDRVLAKRALGMPGVRSPMFDLFKRKSDQDENRPWMARLTAGLARSREKIAGALGDVFARRKLDAETLDELENVLITADVGIAATQHLLQDLTARWKAAGGEADPKSLLKEALADLLAPLERPLSIGAARPFVIMLAGVNGAGKTTSIGKLAKRFQSQGFSVLLAAGDTFRAAAREQLAVWGERNGVTVISQAGGDPGAVMFDAIAAARRAAHRRRAGRYGRPVTHAVAADGGNPQGPTRDSKGRPGRPA